jgi:hypothetical protein
MSRGGVFVLGNGARLLLLLVNRRMSLLRFQKTALVVAGMTLVVVSTELYFGWLEHGVQPAQITASVDLREKVPVVKLAPEVDRS